MRIFSFETDLSLNEINKRLECLLENEKHCSWNIFQDYTSSRCGLHLYQNENSVSGYYENGEFSSRTHALEKAKVWTKIKIKDHNGKRKIAGYTYFCPSLSLAILAGILVLLLEEELLGLSLATIILCILYIGIYQDESKMVKEIKKLLH